MRTQLVAFNDAHIKKDLTQMWCVVTAVAHWLEGDTLMTLIHIDDAEGVCHLVRVTGCMFLTALDAIDYAGQLKAQSRFKDLALVMSLWLKWSWGLQDHGVGDDGEVDWQKDIVAYAKKGGIDLAQAGAGHETARALDEHNGVKAMRGTKKVGKWKWPSTYRELRGTGEAFGTDHYDITKLSREERAEMSDDGKDPLSDVPEEFLLNDLLCFQ